MLRDIAALRLDVGDLVAYTLVNMQGSLIPLGTDVSIRCPSESVDLVFTCDTYHHFERFQQSLASIFLALKSGGRLVLIDFEWILGLLREFLLGRVRAGKVVFQSEVVSAGFEFSDEIDVVAFEENDLFRYTTPTEYTSSHAFSGEADTMQRLVDKLVQPLPILRLKDMSADWTAVLYVVTVFMVSLVGVWMEFGVEAGGEIPTAVQLVANDAKSPQKDYPAGQLGEAVRLGESLVNETSKHPLTRSLVGNSLSCTSCHLDAGRHLDAASFIGVASAYPAYSPREMSVITLEDRIANCFIRSQNGSRPKNGSKALVAMAAYITWLSEGTPLRMNPAKPLGPNHMMILAAPAQRPSIERGQTLYENRCAFCHGDEGGGGDDGPPVWGDNSFNDGAGLTGIPKMASWLKVAMPLDDTDLTDQESFDLAAYVNSHERPVFQGEQPNNDANRTRNPTSNGAEK